MDRTSLSLLERLRRESDPRSWARLVELYTPLLRRWLARYQVQDTDAEDLVQEVLMVVVRELPEFEHNQRTGAFRSWLRGILVHRLRNFWRTRQYRPLAIGDTEIKPLLDELADKSSELSRLWDRQHDEHVVERLLAWVRASFEPVTWKAFCRQMMDGAPAAEVAAELDISVDSAYAAKSRVLRLLRQEARGLID